MPKWYPRNSRAYFAAVTHSTVDASARITFSTLLDIAGAEGDVGDDGTVYYMGTPVTEAVIGGLTGLKTSRQQMLALRQLEAQHLVWMRDGRIGFTETGRVCDFKPDPSAAERMKRVRERSRTEANSSRNVTVLEEKRREEIESSVSVSPNGLTPTGGSVKPRRRSEQTSILEPEWLVALRADVEAIKSREIASLNVDERFAVARYHAAVFGHCRVKEPTNRAKAGGVATSLTHFIAHLERQRIEGMTVSQYFKYGTRHHERIGRGVWLRPADLVADLEVVA